MLKKNLLGTNQDQSQLLNLDIKDIVRKRNLALDEEEVSASTRKLRQMIQPDSTNISPNKSPPKKNLLA